MQTQQISAWTEEPGLFSFSRYSIANPDHGKRNEDRIIADQQQGLAAVFDGVGSAAGDIASRIAASVIRQGWQKAREQILATEQDKEPDLCTLLIDLVEEANNQISTRGNRQAEKRDAGQKTATTAAIATFWQQGKPHEDQSCIMTYAHVGDSRIYLLRQHAELLPLTRDDGYLGILLREQKISEAEARKIDQADQVAELSETELGYFHKRNGITQALGDQRPHHLQVHCNQITLVPGDRILLCSDGLHDNLTDREIGATLKSRARSTIARKLVQQALERSQLDGEHLRAKTDDISAVVVTYEHKIASGKL